MPTFKLDGQEIPFEPGETIIQAARRAGIEIPHYCWHPGLSVAANCRMCLVEIGPPPGRKPMMLDVLGWSADAGDYVAEQKPKLQPACQAAAADGMEVKSNTSEHVLRARSAVQELLLLNHPVDCPICDQAGECKLQDYWLEHQASKKRMHDEPVHKPKAVPFGPTIVYDAERCVLCTRCVRFSEEVAKDPVLSVRERGNLNEIVVAPGRELDHDYTLMTEFVCPVGALTARDFRFKARVWFLRSADTVCTGCATGCNALADFDPRHQKVYRYRPRENEKVNGYWMCDEGMLDYRRIHEGRVLEARYKGKATELTTAVKRAAKVLAEASADRLAVVLSAQHSNEDNYALLTLARDYLGAGELYLAAKPDGEGDEILRHADKNPNRAGVVGLCTSSPPHPVAELVDKVKDGSVTHILALGIEAEAEVTASLVGHTHVVALATHESAALEGARVVLPASSWAESEGTFVNANELAQRSGRVVRPLGASEPAWRLVSLLARAMGHELEWKRVAELRSAMAPVAGATVAAVEAQAGAIN